MIAQRIEPTLSLMVITLLLRGHGRRADRRARGLEGRHAGSTAPSWRSRCSASRCRCSWSAISWPTSSRCSSNGCRCRATRRSSGGIWPWLENLILPAIALGCVYIALIARITRATMLEVLQQDYIRTARAKGARAARHPVRARAQERRGADRHRHRHRHRAPDRRRGGDRERVRHSRPRPPHRRRHPAPRLSGHPGRRAAVQLRLRAGQSRDRPPLHRCSIRGSGIERRPPSHADRRRASPSRPRCPTCCRQSSRGAASSDSCGAIRPSPSAARCCPRCC